MTRITALRAAAVIAFIQGLVQAWTVATVEPRGFAETIVVTTMKGSHLSFGGMSRTYWDLYFGYGMFASATWILEAILLWIVAGMGRNDERGVKAILALLIVANAAHAAATFVWFTPLSLVFDVPVVLLLAVGLKLRATKA